MRTKTSPITVIFNIFKYVVLILAAVIALVPVCVCILTAFKTTDEYNASSVLDLPKTFAYFDCFRICRCNACLRFKPFPVQRKRSDPEPVYVCSTDSWYCYTGYCLSDHVFLRSDQSSLRIYDRINGHRYYFHLHFPAVLREPSGIFR